MAGNFDEVIRLLKVLTEKVRIGEMELPREMEDCLAELMNTVRESKLYRPDPEKYADGDYRSRIDEIREFTERSSELRLEEWDYETFYFLFKLYGRGNNRCLKFGENLYQWENDNAAFDERKNYVHDKPYIIRCDPKDNIDPRDNIRYILSSPYDFGIMIRMTHDHYKKLIKNYEKVDNCGRPLTPDSPLPEAYYIDFDFLKEILADPYTVVYVEFYRRGVYRIENYDEEYFLRAPDGNLILSYEKDGKYTF